MTQDKLQICTLCKRPFTGHGNNPLPQANGRCCNACNLQVVFARWHMIMPTLKMNSGDLDETTKMVNEIFDKTAELAEESEEETEERRHD